jgi:tRNA-Thr(GGU) m(6)t(6)A37 methyltransferase TsaA
VSKHESREHLTPIGHVKSELRETSDAPRQAHLGAPPARIEFAPEFEAHAADLKKGDGIWILTWLDRASRDIAAVHPEGNANNPLTGIFATRAPHRPNPIGLHRAVIISRDRDSITVNALEALNGTPVLDVKPVLPEELGPIPSR